jgi:hypothetical protein
MKLTFWILLVLVILLILAIKYLPWWALILLLVGGGLLLQWGVKFGLQYVMLLPFKAKGQVLKGATVQVHNIQPTNMPTLRQDDTDLAEFAAKRSRYHQLKWYSLDVSIAPTQPESAVPFSAWDPRDLLLVAPGKKVRRLENLADADACEIHGYEIYQADRFQFDQVNQHLGSQRLKLLVGVEPGTQQLQFRYYLELFGTIDFPTATVSQPQIKSA